METSKEESDGRVQIAHIVSQGDGKLEAVQTATAQVEATADESTEVQ